MAVTEVTQTSWVSRIGDSFRGMLFGVLLFLLALPLLFWNEGRAVRRTRTLAAGAASVIPVPADRIDPRNEGKLIHVSGMLSADGTLSDPLFGISSRGIALERQVEMYQWVEHSSVKSEKQLGGSVKKTTVYTYEKEWSSSPVDSSKFKEPGHGNPAFTITEEKWYAGNVRLGAFSLPPEMIRRIGGAVPYSVPPDLKFPTGMSGFIVNGAIMIPASASAPAVPDVPQIGDVRITFRQILPHEISVIAGQSGHRFQVFPTKQGTILLLADSVQSAEAMFRRAESANTFWTWVWRIVGFLMMLIGIGMALRPLSTLADVLPLLGDLVGAGASLVAFLIALPCWLIVIALSWIVYRPLLAGVLLAVAGGAVFFLLRRRKKKAPAAA